MNTFFIFLFIFVIGIAYGQMIGVLPTSNSEAEVDWISIGLVFCFFLLLFIVYKRFDNADNDLEHSRQRDEVQHEISEK